MPIPAFVGPLVGGLAGGFGGKNQARAANQPTRFSETSSMSPYRVGSNPYLDWYMGEAFNTYNNRPSFDDSFALQQYQNLGGGGRGGGVGVPGFADIWGQVSGAMGGIGGTRDAERRLRNFQVNLRPEHQALISGEFLDQNNPHIQGVLGNFAREAEENFARSLPTITAQFGGAGRYGSGLQREAVEGASEEYMESVQGQQAQILAQNYEAERDRMVQGLNMAAQLDAAGRSDLGGVIRQQMASRAQVLSSALSGYMGLLGAGLQAGASRDALLMNSAFGLDEMRANQDMGPLSWLGNQWLPIMEAFGTRSTSGMQQGPRVSPMGGFLQGGIGGALGGAGLGGQFGGKGGGGWSPATQANVANYFNSNPMIGLPSDIRLKRGVVRLPVDYLPGVPLAVWTWKHNGLPDVGVIAQDMLAVYPHRVFDVNGILHVRY